MDSDIVTDYADVPAASGPLRTFVARPAGSGPWPGLLVIQEVFGLTPHIEDVTRRLAAQGYLAVAPDLYTNDSVRAALTIDDIEGAIAVGQQQDAEAALDALPADRRKAVRSAVEWRKGNMARMGSFVADLAETLTWLRARPDVRSERIGSIGWCMGGGLNGALIARGVDLQAAVIYYGPIPPLDAVANIKCPVLGQYGKEDTAITSRVPEFEAAMQAADKDLTVHLYDAPHAFNNEDRASYRPDAAASAWNRTVEFLARHLQDDA